MADQIVLQFSTSTALASELIRRLSHSPFSHIDIMLADGNLLGASDQGKHGKVIQGNPRGVAIRPPDYQEFGIRRRLVINTPVAQAIVDSAMQEIGKPFDDSALREFLSDAIVRDWRKPTKWFCSELIAHAFDEAGYWAPMRLNVPKNRISPADFLMLLTLDPRVANWATFYDRVVGLKLGPKEK